MLKITCHTAVIILSVFLFWGNSFAQIVESHDDSLAIELTAPDTLAAKSPRGAMLRSLVVPGWGQFYNGKWFKGLVLGGTETGLIINAVVQNQWAQAADNIYDRDFYRENRSLSIWWLGGAILYSIADAFVDAHLSDFDDDPLVTMNVESEKTFDLQKYPVYKVSLKIPL